MKLFFKICGILILAQAAEKFSKCSLFGSAQGSPDACAASFTDSISIQYNGSINITAKMIKIISLTVRPNFFPILFFSLIL